jgi:alpha-methylacyl-CoA racemase
MGALTGVRVIEMAGIGPAPFCGMLLADMGAEVLRIDRPGSFDHSISIPPRFDLLNRNKRSVALDAKSEAGRAALLRLIRGADALIEGFRPGVMERLGIGPESCLKENPALVFGRMTGWGQEGPLSHSASHDINYIASSGALHAIGRAGGPPAIPLNLVGDFGGGALYLAMGVLAALISARSTGVGQVVDAAIVDGVANLLSMHYGLRQAGFWSVDRGSNMLDGGAPFYDVYETSDGRFVAIGAIENRFFGELLRRLGFNGAELPQQNDREGWATIRARLAEVFKSRTRDEWSRLLEGTDACFAAVLDMDECVHHPHHVARGTYVELDGVLHPAPAPRFSATPSEIRKAPSAPGEDTRSVLADCGFSEEEIAALTEAGAIN